MSTVPLPEMLDTPDALRLVPPRPRATLVLASVGSDAVLRRRLAAVLPACRRTGSELIVVRAAASRHLESQYPNARFLPAPADNDPTQMRELGARAARGQMLLFTSDSADADMSWVDIVAHSPVDHSK